MGDNSYHFQEMSNEKTFCFTTHFLKGKFDNGIHIILHDIKIFGIQLKNTKFILIGNMHYIKNSTYIQIFPIEMKI